MKKLVTLLLSLLLTICIYSQEHRVNTFRDNKINHLLDSKPDVIDSTSNQYEVCYKYIWCNEEGHKLTVVYVKDIPYESKEKWLYNLKTRAAHEILLNNISNKTLERIRNYNKELQQLNNHKFKTMSKKDKKFKKGQLAMFTQIVRNRCGHIVSQEEVLVQVMCKRDDDNELAVFIPKTGGIWINASDLRPLKRGFEAINAYRIWKA